ncbi:pentatricopeptide repeat-containing protein At2g17210 [Magnolia sinica]|uniref:pentatricopeptide repeat-containing protein At2g17210 n=1 Tax=Magnolia sinica TaxID=86752 RepID=UPI002658767C|nr:pentatricopeptide repeat-containing protein At2g17210 [Magnolia sinica]
MRFLKLPNWNLMIRESAMKMQWEEVLSHCYEMRRAGVVIADPSLLPPILKACTKLQLKKHGVSVHTAVIKKGFQLCTSVANSILDFYIKCVEVESALNAFHCMGIKDSVSWNVMIHGCLNHGLTVEGLNLYGQARLAGFIPNVSTLILLVQACWSLGPMQVGFCIHGLIIRSGFLSVVSVQNSLLSMYVKLCDMESARRLFDEMSERDVISWSVMISACAQSGEACVALWLFQEMCSVGVVPDGHTTVSILGACTALGDIGRGRVIHGYVIRHGFEFDLHVGNALVDMYSKCTDVESAYEVFDAMPQKNTVSWNSFLSGLVHNEQYSEALRLFDSMEKVGIESDGVTLVNLLQLCKNVGDAVGCKCIHSVIIRKGFGMNETVLNSLLDAYAKCQLVELAWKLFERMGKRNMISWTVMIGGFARCGKPDEAISLFEEMKLAQEKPNAVTMLGLIDACLTLADLNRSKWAHGLVIRNGMADEVVVGTVLLEMYAKCGDVDASRRVFDEMPERNVVSWSAMIAAYGINGHAREALALLREMKFHGVKPNKITMLSALSACSHGGLLEEGRSCFEEMIREHGFDPGSEHYSCMVDMLGRAGDLNKAMEMIENMPQGIAAGASLWGALLSACRNHGNSELGSGAASHVLELEPSSSAGYLIASSMYAAGGLWRDAARMRWLVKEKGVKVVAGYSLVHVDQRAHRFVAGDRAHPQSAEIYAMVEHLHGCMRERKNDSSYTI